VAGSCEHTNETSGSINGGEFLDKPSGYQLLNNDFVRAAIAQSV
jgi:hypothetical protein